MRVVKLGGASIACAEQRGAVATAVTAAVRERAEPVVVVHGGGPEIDRWSARLGVGAVRRGGRRVTTPEALEVVTAVLAGLLNKAMVGALLDAGVDAVGLSGVDDGLLSATVVDDGGWGRVGRVERVRPALLHRLVAFGRTPVVAPVCRADDGGELNVNADEVAAALAAALGASELLFVTDVTGVHDGDRERTVLTASEARALVESDSARDGMAVKLDAACAALASGVGSVRVGPVAALREPTVGTRVLDGWELPA